MPLAAADLAAFVDEDMPGYALATLSAGAVPGLFSLAPGEAFGVSGSRPIFKAVGTAVSTVAEGTAITINSIAYTVAGISIDGGTGMTLLVLETT